MWPVLAIAAVTAIAQHYQAEKARGAAADCKACPEADAFITNEPGLPIAIRTADCVPVFIYDPVKRVIALAHAGWKGTHKHIAAKTVKTLCMVYHCYFFINIHPVRSHTI